MRKNTVARFSYKKTLFMRRAREVRRECDRVFHDDRTGLMVSMGEVLQLAKRLVSCGLRSETLRAQVENAGYANPDRVRKMFADSAWEIDTYSHRLLEVADKLKITVPVYNSRLDPMRDDFDRDAEERKARLIEEIGGSGAEDNDGSTKS